jgi:hypothetical protein
MIDILFSMPWHCGEHWHLSNYWITEDGYTVETLDVSDHEAIEEEELPSEDAQQSAWAQYYRDVLDTGTDPLGHFFAGQPTRKENQRWTFEFRRGIGGPCICYSRRGRGPRLVWHQLPDRIAEWIGLFDHVAMKRRPRICWAEDYNDFIETITFSGEGQITSVRKGITRFTALVEVDVARSASVIARELKTAARKALRRTKK